MKLLPHLAKLIRYHSLVSSTSAGSGHLTSSLSATDLITTLFFGGFFKFDVKNPQNPRNDRLIFSKGHASPLFYSAWAVAGGIPTRELTAFRQFGSRLEGHPTMEFPFTEVPTGSLGQGLSVGVGMAITAKYLDKLPYKTYVLLGDSEMAEGSVWEAIHNASFYKLNNLIGIIDVNRLGQSRQTMYGHNVQAYKTRLTAFGWEAIVTNGHSFSQIRQALKQAQKAKDRPVMIIAKTIKGKGISFLEDKEGWHGIALKPAKCDLALAELGSVDKHLKGHLLKPQNSQPKTPIASTIKPVSYQPDQMVATRKAYGNALVRIYPHYPNMVVLDAEVSNSTFAGDFKANVPDKFFEMFIAEQNMVGVALGMWRRGKLPFVSTFAAFFSRAFDQIRMCQYAQANLKFVGSHAGVSIGEDGASQMGLEDLAMFRNLLHSVVLYPSDAVSTEKLVEAAAKHTGIVYLRTTRQPTPIIYSHNQPFKIGGSQVVRHSSQDQITVVAAGITLHEALTAYAELKNIGVLIRVVDLYSIKPLDTTTLKKASRDTKATITVEDHHLEGGLGEAVSGYLAQYGAKVYSLAVSKMPRSGKPQELLDYEEISSTAIVSKVKQVLGIIKPS